MIRHNDGLILLEERASRSIMGVLQENRANGDAKHYGA